MIWIIIVRGIIYGFIIGIIYALFATGLTLIFGIMNVVNMCHGELYMLGAVGVWALTKYLGMNYFLAVLVTIISVSLFGIIVNHVAIRPLINKKPSWLILISTLGISLILLQSAMAVIGRRGLGVEPPLKGSIDFGEISIARGDIMLIIVGLAIMVALFTFLKRSSLGKDMRATIQSPIGAALSGINTQKVYDYVMILASGIAAFGGALTVPFYTADPLIGQSMLLKGMAIVVTAGMGNLIGASILGVVFGIIENLFGIFFDPYFKNSFIFAILSLIHISEPTRPY